MTNENEIIGRIFCIAELAGSDSTVGFQVVEGKTDEVMDMLESQGLMLKRNQLDTPADFFANAMEVNALAERESEKSNDCVWIAAVHGGSKS